MCLLDGVSFCFPSQPQALEFWDVNSSLFIASWVLAGFTHPTLFPPLVPACWPLLSPRPPHPSSPWLWHSLHQPGSPSTPPRYSHLKTHVFRCASVLEDARRFWLTPSIQLLISGSTCMVFLLLQPFRPIDVPGPLSRCLPLSVTHPRSDGPGPLPTHLSPTTYITVPLAVLMPSGLLSDVTLSEASLCMPTIQSRPASALSQHFLPPCPASWFPPDKL